MISVYEYFDYRKLLKDLFKEQKSRNKYFSYRILAELAGFTSAGFFSKILQGQVNISAQKVLSFASAFQLTKAETRYFELLVAFNQAQNHEERKYYFEQLVSVRKQKGTSEKIEHYELFNEWYYVVIWELLTFFPFSGNYKELGNMLQPAIQSGDAKRAIQSLVRIGLISRKADGYYYRVKQKIEPQECWKQLAWANNQLNSVILTKNAICKLDDNGKEISTRTLSISECCYEQIKSKINLLQKEIELLVRNDINPDRVYNLNFQLFPVSKVYYSSADEGIQSTD